MTQEEFIAIVKEDKLIEDYEEHTKLRYSAVKYYVENYIKLSINGVLLSVLPPESDYDKVLVNDAFTQIKLKLKL